MLQRQPRVGDIVDDYCPRERRVSDHAVVAMVEDEVRQTRCTTCDTEHEYRQGKTPPGRKKAANPLPPKPHTGAVAVAAPLPPDPVGEPGAEDSADATATPGQPDALAADRAAGTPAPPEGSVHRRLIRAVLPRIEGEIPARQAPEFTMHRANTRPATHGRPPRAGQGGQGRQGGQASGNSRHSGHRTGTGGSFGTKGTRGGHGGPAGAGGARHGGPPGGAHGPRKKH